MLIRLFAILAILLLTPTSERAAFFVSEFAGGQAISAPPSVTSINLSGTMTYPNGSTAGFVIGTITDTLDFGSFTIPPGTNTLQNGGTDSFGTACDAANTTNFKIVSNTTLELNATLSGTFNVCVVGTFGPSSLVQAFAVVGTTASQTISSVFLSSGGSFAGGSGSGTVAAAVGVTMSPASPAFSGSLVLISSGVDHANTTCSSSNSTNFHLSSSNIVLSTTLAASSYPGVCVQATAGSSTFTQAFTLVGTSAGAVFSQTVKNIAGSTTPTIAGTTQVPVHFGTMFPPNVVPVTNILVASIGGTPLTNYQIDSQQCSFWATTPTDSLRFCPFSGFVPQLAAGGTAPIQFTQTAGSFPTSSSVTPATISAASDFKVALSNMNSSYIRQIADTTAVWWGVFPGFYETGGAISGGYVRNQPQPTGGGTGQGLLGFNCLQTSANCITPSNYRASPSLTTASGSAVLTFAANQIPAHYPGGNPGQVTIRDITNTSAIPDNTTVSSSTSVAPFTVSMSTPAAASIPTTDTIEYGYTIRGGTSNGAFTVNINGSGIVTSINVTKPGSGFTAIGSGAMTADIDTILNEYGSTDPPACATAGSAAAFTGTYSAGAITASGLTGAISQGQIVTDSTGTTALVTGSSSPWAVNHTLTNGAMTANVPLCVYTSGPAMKGYAGFGAYLDNISGLPDTWERFRFTIEAWTGPTGIYAIKPVITTDSSIWKNQSGFPTRTYDADFMNGATEVAGCAQGGSNNFWCAITEQVNGSWTTLDPCASCATGASGRPVWLPTTTGTYSSSNSQALAQVIVAPSSADLMFIHASHAAPPLDNSVVPTPLVLTTSTASFGSPVYPNLYAPYSHGGMDNTIDFGSGGSSHIGLGPMGGLWGAWYLSAQNGASDGGASYLQNVRVAADLLTGVMEGPRYDDSGLPLNLFNASTYTPPSAFSGDVPMWDATLSNKSTNVTFGYPHFMWQGDTFSQGPMLNQSIESPEYGDQSHWPELERADYLIEAERYILQNWIDEAEPLALGASIVESPPRSLSFGSIRYDAQLMYSYIHRIDSWTMNGVGPLAYLGPANEPAIQYYQHVVSNSYAMNDAFFSFVGSGNFWDTNTGASMMGFTSNSSRVALGFPATPWETIPGTAERSSYSTFIDYYWAMNTADMAILDNGNNAALTDFATTALDHDWVKNNAVNSCTYNAVAYVSPWAKDTPTQTPNAGFDATTLTPPQRGNGPVRAGTTIHTEAGSSTVSASLTTIGVGNFVPTATAPVSAGGTVIPLSSVTTPQAGIVSFGMVLKDLTHPTALTWPTYVTGTPTGLNVPISSPVTGPGISMGDQIVFSSNWAWNYPVFSTTRLVTGSRVILANINWNDEQSPNDQNQGVTTTTWPPNSSPQVNDGDIDYLCMDASGAAFGVWSTTSCGSPTPVTWGVTANFSMATVANASCPAASAGDWRNPAAGGEEETEMWPTARWRQALNGVLGTSTDAATAQTNLGPWILPANNTYRGVAGAAPPGWAGDNHF